MPSLCPHPIFSVIRRVGCAGDKHLCVSSMLGSHLPPMLSTLFLIWRQGQDSEWTVPSRISGLVCREARQPLDLDDLEGHPSLCWGCPYLKF